jgi:hypothetical protein
MVTVQDKTILLDLFSVLLIIIIILFSLALQPSADYGLIVNKVP